MVNLSGAVRAISCRTQANPQKTDLPPGAADTFSKADCPNRALRLVVERVFAALDLLGYFRSLSMAYITPAPSEQIYLARYPYVGPHIKRPIHRQPRRFSGAFAKRLIEVLTQVG